jgi:transposase
MEACATVHGWGREFEKLGHDVRLIPPVYVKPFIKRQKNDAADAEAIAEAALRPTMRFVAVKTEDQRRLGFAKLTRIDRKCHFFPTDRRQTGILVNVHSGRS